MCGTEGCSDPVRAKGLCVRHYQQQWRTGSADITRPNPHGSPEERFWRKVQKGAEAECWEWDGRRDKDGYGTLRVGSTQVRAHRFSYELHVGPIDGLVRHRCNNPPCVNPSHLRPGTHQENMDDRKAAGNYRRKTHCKHGHEFTPENTSIERGGRYCRACRRRRSAEQRARRKVA